MDLLIPCLASRVCWPSSSRTHVSAELWEGIEADTGDVLWSMPGKVGPRRYMSLAVSKHRWANN